MREPIRWEDRTGRVRWQPRLDNGYAYWHDHWVALRWLPTDYESVLGAVLCRWRWRAKWIARREQRRRDRQFQRTMRPTEDT